MATTDVPHYGMFTTEGNRLVLENIARALTLTFPPTQGKEPIVAWISEQVLKQGGGYDKVGEVYDTVVRDEIYKTLDTWMG